MPILVNPLSSAERLYRNKDELSQSATSCGWISLVLDHRMDCVGGGRSNYDLDLVLGLAKLRRLQRFGYS